MIIILICHRPLSCYITWALAFSAFDQHFTALTTQLYFPDDHVNNRDWIFDQRLVLDISQDAGIEIGRFDFVVEAG